MSFQVEWKVEVSPNVHEIIRNFEDLDNSLSNASRSDVMWNAVFKKISTFIQRRFEEGKSNWRPLTRKYLKWKVSASRRGVQVPVGSFGRRVVKLTAMGRLTDTMYPSATEKRFANIFETSAIPNGMRMRYAISGNKLPYAKFFDNKRPFFWITNEEAEEVFKTMENHILKGL